MVYDADPYRDALAYFAEKETRGHSFGWGEACYDFAIDRMNHAEVDYFTLAVAHAFGHWKGDEIEDFEPQPDLDRLAETYKRAWIDRYGDVPSWRHPKYN